MQLNVFEQCVNIETEWSWIELQWIPRQSPKMIHENVHLHRNRRGRFICNGSNHKLFSHNADVVGNVFTFLNNIDRMHQWIFGWNVIRTFQMDQLGSVHLVEIKLNLHCSRFYEWIIDTLLCCKWLCLLLFFCAPFMCALAFY